MFINATVSVSFGFAFFFDELLKCVALSSFFFAAYSSKLRHFVPRVVVSFELLEVALVSVVSITLCPQEEQNLFEDSKLLPHLEQNMI
jgi:hypothetical protein